MEGIIISPLEIIEGGFTRYELPPEGISLLGYMVRRMHKTELLLYASDLIAQQRFPHALAQVAHYAAASSTSFGQLYCEPASDKVGSSVMERDPATHAVVMATYENSTPESRFSYHAQLPNDDCFSGWEVAAGSKISLRGWSKAVQPHLSFTSAAGCYQAELEGTIYHEIIPRIVGSWIIRAHGLLTLQDSQGFVGELTLRRNATATIVIKCPHEDKAILTRDITVS